MCSTVLGQPLPLPDDRPIGDARTVVMIFLLDVTIGRS